MSTHTIPKIGFACKWIDYPHQTDGIKPKDDCRKYNTGTTTVAWLNRQPKAVAEQKLYDLMVSNIEATRLLVERVSKLENNLRMVRLSSDMLPVYTEPQWSYFYQCGEIQQELEKRFRPIGEIGRASDVRLSFHPGPFTVLASDRDDIVEKSIEEFEFHVDMARWMGYGLSFQDFKINIHISGKRGTEGIKNVLPRLSTEARNTITIENDEKRWGLEHSLELADDLALVLDIHHHWCREGTYISATDDRFKRVIESWRGERPVIHYSYSRDEFVQKHDNFPNRNLLMESGIARSKLFAHSDFYPNKHVNEWALSFLPYADIMCEAKGKNLASHALWNFYKTFDGKKVASQSVPLIESM